MILIVHPQARISSVKYPSEDQYWSKGMGGREGGRRRRGRGRREREKKKEMRELEIAGERRR